LRTVRRSMPSRAAIATLLPPCAQASTPPAKGKPPNRTGTGTENDLRGEHGTHDQLTRYFCTPTTITAGVIKHLADPL